MSDKPKCAGSVWEEYHRRSCNKTGSLEHDGKTWCKAHHPPSKAERNQKWREKFDADMEISERKRKAEAKESAFREWAADYVRTYAPDAVQEWEEKNA